MLTAGHCNTIAALATLIHLTACASLLASACRYANTCQSMSNEWDLQRNAQLQELQAHEDAVRELAHQRYLELVTECQAYRGYPEEELQVLPPPVPSMCSLRPCQAHDLLVAAAVLLFRLSTVEYFLN